MVQYIKIVNFGPIRDEVELNFEALDPDGSPAYEVEMPDGQKLLRLAYLYGANASGKTTVLKAIEFLRKLWLAPLNNKDEDLGYEPFLFRSNADNYPSTIELGFYVANTRHIYRVQFNKHSVLEESMVIYRTHQPSELFSRTTDLDKRLSHVQFGPSVKRAANEINALETATLHNNTVLGAFQKTNVDLPDFEKLNQWGKRFLGGLINAATDLTGYAGYNLSKDPGLAKWMDIFLNKADKNIRGVSVKTEKPPDIDSLFALLPKDTPKETEQSLRDIAMQRQISFLHVLEGNEVYALPLAMESSGSTRFLGLGAVLYNLLIIPSFYLH